MLQKKSRESQQGNWSYQKLFKNLPRNSLQTIYKLFITPHLDYDDIVYDRSDNESFISKLEQVQCNAALVITGAIKCLESLESRRRLRRLFILHKVISNGHPAYLYKLIPKKSYQYITRNVNDIATYQCTAAAFKF